MKSLIFRRLPADNELNASSCKFGDESNEISNPFPPKNQIPESGLSHCPPPPGGGVTLGLFGWGCAAGTLELLAYIRTSSSEFSYLIVD